MPSTYDMGNNTRLIRCQNCRSQILYNIKDIEVEEYYDNRQSYIVNVVYCSTCHRRIVVLPF